MPTPFRPFSSNCSRQVLFDRSPLAQDVDAFLVFFQHALDQHDADLFFEDGIFVERIPD